MITTRHTCLELSHDLLQTVRRTWASDHGSVVEWLAARSQVFDARMQVGVATPLREIEGRDPLTRSREAIDRMELAESGSPERSELAAAACQTLALRPASKAESLGVS